MDMIHTVVSLKYWAARNSGGGANLPQFTWNRGQGDAVLPDMLKFFKESLPGAAKLPCLSSTPSHAAVRNQPVPDPGSAVDCALAT